MVSGYSGGFVENPTYREICSATTGHAEVIQVYFDPKKISLELILEVFWATHDPTTLNRQGADVGPPVTANLRFIAHATEGDAVHLAAQSPRDRLGQ